MNTREYKLGRKERKGQNKGFLELTLPQSDAAHPSCSTSISFSEHGQEVRAWAGGHGAETHLAWAPTVGLIPPWPENRLPDNPGHEAGISI